MGEHLIYGGIKKHSILLIPTWTYDYDYDYEYTALSVQHVPWVWRWHSQIRWSGYSCVVNPLPLILAFIDCMHNDWVHLGLHDQPSNTWHMLECLNIWWTIKHMSHAGVSESMMNHQTHDTCWSVWIYVGPSNSWHTMEWAVRLMLFIHIIHNMISININNSWCGH